MSTRRQPATPARCPASVAAMFCAALAACAGSAHAGRSCESKPPTVDTLQRAMALAERTAAHLERSGASVVVLARAGQDLSEYGLRYSHLGLAYRETLPASPGAPATAVWRVVHKLNHCGTAQASVYRQGLGEFFMDDLFRYEAAIVVLAPQAQAHLSTLLRDNARVATLHTAAYNMVAYPWAQTYQQSNQWALETLAMAQGEQEGRQGGGQQGGRTQAQSWLQQNGYEPTTLRLSTLKRLGARVTAANVSFDDHPNDKRFSNRIETVTVDSVFNWLSRTGLGMPVQVIR